MMEIDTSIGFGFDIIPQHWSESQKSAPLLVSMIEQCLINVHSASCWMMMTWGSFQDPIRHLGLAMSRSREIRFCFCNFCFQSPRHYLLEFMMTSSNKTLSALLALCAGDSPVTGEFPSQRPVTRGFFLLIYAWINVWVNNRETGDLRRHCDHYALTVMYKAAL